MATSFLKSMQQANVTTDTVAATSLMAEVNAASAE